MKLLTILVMVCSLLLGCAHLPKQNGNCPAEFPVKGNYDSMIYHTMGGTYYWQTEAEWCFKTEAAARAAGYRPVKSVGEVGSRDLSRSRG